jgi:hypothetical protein
MEGSDHGYLFVLLTDVGDPSLLSRQLLFILNEAVSLDMITLEEQARGSPHVVLRVRPRHLASRLRSSSSADFPLPDSPALDSPLRTFVALPSFRPAAIPHGSNGRHKLPYISPSHWSLANVGGRWQSILCVHLQGHVEALPAASSSAVLLRPLRSAKV